MPASCGKLPHDQSVANACTTSMKLQNDPPAMVDIHCHLLPGIDDGAANLDESLEMACLAVQDGISSVIATPHQLGGFSQNSGDIIRQATRLLQQELNRAQIPLRVLPGADVRIEERLVQKVRSGQVLSLANHRKHILLELPHELYFPVQPLLRQLHSAGMVGILSHPERNRGILQQRSVVADLVEAGCLMQITAGSLTGSMGPVCQEFCHWMLSEGLVHFVATDAHGPTTRRPLLKRSWDEVARLTDEATARRLCVEFPAKVAAGQDVPAGRHRHRSRRPSGWFGLRKTG